MFSQLRETVEVINKLNKTDFVIKKIDQDEIKEQKENIADLKDLLSDYSKAIRLLEEKDPIERIDLTAFYAEVHVLLNNLGWHIRQVDELLTRFLKSLPPLEEE